jgi:ribosomal protein S18 acetylase RimI-like enzyme
VRIRSARAADAKGLARIFKESWELAYRGMIPEAHLDRLVRRRDAEWWRTSLRSSERMLVIEVAGTLAGYATYGPARAKGAPQGEIYELYLSPVYQGLGFGEHLFEACRHMLDLRRLKGLVVWALLDNEAACNFYWRRGGRPKASTHEQFGDVKLEKIAFVWP